MKASAVLLILPFFAFFAGCGEIPNEDSRNVDAILSPDGSRIAFVRSFRYYFKKATVFDPGGWEETVFGETSVYIVDKSSEKVTKLSRIGEDLYYDAYYSPINISWEGDLIAYGVQYTVYITDVNGVSKGTLDFSTEKYGPPMPFTLSGDGERLFYIGRAPWEFGREGLYSIRLDGSGRTFISDLVKMGFVNGYDMTWDSSQGCILIADVSSGIENLVVWQINPDGKDLKRSEQGAVEYLRRKLGGPPFSELGKLTRDITHAEWGVPPPEEFD